jgi:BirA family biotin operon repressor/biotin-[acetyl-CoA-carboxylase] ligase
VLRFLGTTGSTNDDARAWAAAGAPHGSTVVAEAQTAGRGRLGRRWESPPAGNLYLSTVIRRDWPPARVPLLCLAAAVAVAEVAGEAYRIKWPNDVLAPDGRKVAGVLAEAEWEDRRLRFAVVGVGVNVRAAPALPTAQRLEADGVPRDPRVLARELVAALLVHADREPADLLLLWKERSATLGREVRVGEVTGLAVGLDADGALVVRTAGGDRRVLAGDVEMIGDFGAR